MEEAADINQQAVSGAAPGVAHAPRRARVAALLLALALPGAHAHASCALGVALPSDRPATTVSTASALEQAVRAANRTGHRRILLRDGRYVLRHTLVIRAPQITVRSASGERDGVVVRGPGMRGPVPHVFLVQASDFTLADLTVGWVRNHAVQIQGERGANRPWLRNVRFVDSGEQLLKVTGSRSGAGVSGGIVEGCLFEFSAGVAPQWYTGGIDAHGARGWIVRHNVFRHIRSPEARLAEHAVHFWSDATDTLVEGNLIVDSDRGIGFGLGARGHRGGIIRNNMVHTVADVGIGLENAPGAKVYNNTVLTQHYVNAIEVRFGATRDVLIANNLVNRAIASRDGAEATLQGNVLHLREEWLADAPNGDLHLARAVPGVVDRGYDIPGARQDFDCQARPRGSRIDIGADEW